MYFVFTCKLLPTSPQDDNWKQTKQTKVHTENSNCMKLSNDKPNIRESMGIDKITN